MEVRGGNFFRMLASEASELFFIGSDNVKFFSMNATALQVCSIGLIMIILILNVCAGQSIEKIEKIVKE